MFPTPNTGANEFIGGSKDVYKRQIQCRASNQRVAFSAAGALSPQHRREPRDVYKRQAEAVKQAAANPAQVARGDLRMVLNLDKIVQTPYFRSYWVQRNITEMKQYTSAVSDLYRTRESYREERVLLRRAPRNTDPGGDIAALAALAPDVYKRQRLECGLCGIPMDRRSDRG